MSTIQSWRSRELWEHLLGTKASSIPALWPLLKPDQDPDGVPARVAFHLHRLGLRGTALTRIPFVIDVVHASELAQGATELTSRDVEELAGQLAVSPTELLRELTALERLEWDFYRISAAHASLVWHRAHRSWRSAGLTNKQAAQLMKYTPAYVSMALGQDKYKRRMILNYQAAEPLAQACKVSGGAQAYIDGLTLLEQRST